MKNIEYITVCLFELNWQKKELFHNTLLFQNHWYCVSIYIFKDFTLFLASEKRENYGVMRDHNLNTHICILILVRTTNDIKNSRFLTLTITWGSGGSQ